MTVKHCVIAAYLVWSAIEALVCVRAWPQLETQLRARIQADEPELERAVTPMVRLYLKETKHG